MNLTQLETVETELKRKRYNQNKVLKLMCLKRRSRGHQECLKRIKGREDMAKTRFKGFSVKKHGCRGLTTRIQGPSHKYVYKPKVYSAKDQSWTSREIYRKIRGLDTKGRTHLRENLKVEGSACETKKTKGLFGKTALVDRYGWD
jgi:hypothetical protein